MYYIDTFYIYITVIIVYIIFQKAYLAFTAKIDIKYETIYYEYKYL